jgi:hypothetical protein
MGKEGINFRMEAILKDNGLIIRLMALELFISKVGNPNMKESGGMIYIMDGEIYIQKLAAGANIKVSLKMV